VAAMVVVQQDAASTPQAPEANNIVIFVIFVIFNDLRL
jgi:hypothetical protein